MKKGILTSFITFTSTYVFVMKDSLIAGGIIAILGFGLWLMFKTMEA